MAEKAKDENASAPPDSVVSMVSEGGCLDIHYLKSPHVRTIHVDGAIGGLTPAARCISMSIFSERWPVPTQITNRLNTDGSVAEEIKDRRVTRRGVIREIEANLILDINTARAMKSWLEEKLGEFERLEKEQKP